MLGLVNIGAFSTQLMCAAIKNNYTCEVSCTLPGCHVKCMMLITSPASARQYFEVCRLAIQSTRLTFQWPCDGCRPFFKPNFVNMEQARVEAGVDEVTFHLFYACSKSLCNSNPDT